MTATHPRTLMHALLVLLLALAMLAMPVHAHAASDEFAANEVGLDDGYVTLTWTGWELSTDGGSIGELDPGDVLTYSFEVAMVDPNASPVTSLMMQRDPFSAAILSASGTESAPLVGSGVTYQGSIDLPVDEMMITTAGEGPYNALLLLTYRVATDTDVASGLWRLVDYGTLEGPAERPTYDGVIRVSNVAQLDEREGVVGDGLAAPGDRVRYEIRSLGGTGDFLRFGSIDPATGVDVYYERGGPNSVRVYADEAMAHLLYTEWRTVTEADLVAGAVVREPWEVDTVLMRESGGLPVQSSRTIEFAPVATEAGSIALGDLQLTATVVDASGVPVDPADAEPGDFLRYGIDHTNAGDVTLNYREITVTDSAGPVLTDVDDALGQAAGGGLGGAAAFSSADAYAHVRPLTEDDLARGYVQAEASVAVGFDATHLADPATAQALIAFAELTPEATWTVDGELVDSNGDGVGQAGEQVQLTYALANDPASLQAVTVASVDESGDIAPLGTGADGRALAIGEAAQWSRTVTITPAMEAAGSLDYATTAHLVGAVDGLSYPVGAAAVEMPEIGEYVAPTLDFAVTADFVDADGDGSPSIGETATFLATLQNIGGHALRDIVLADATTSDLAGILPGDVALAPDGVLTWTVQHRLTAEDFARGSVTYGAVLDARGMAQAAASATLSGVSFAAFEEDLLPELEGVIVLCMDGEPVTELARGEGFGVSLDECGAPVGQGATAYLFSTPVRLGDAALTLTVPQATEPGAHRVAVYGFDGRLVGWAPLTVLGPVDDSGELGTGGSSSEDGAASGEGTSDGTAASEGALASTGVQESVLATWAVAAACVLAGASVLVLRRRRQAAVPK
ncbi:LPXTG cell wall anchor domain-containing protein [Demequina zhanjiangensis]|uniref:LPXTG cell wall anchor domain-containing protein n=1 Tax=Demequina zhanjiangensis TaxID=3051659 RepID=A0ABT8G2S1_9MICO|nr:LPXTG cell wall anchor domain-containing protein [Demequina sp. SYSU T00b26]MDN4473446.1 LPXTG cell wall anchor domain-containing protein [Demequina sp. SYSU T00b26]